MKIIFIPIFVIFLTAQIIYAENFKAATAEWHPYAMQTENGISGIAVDILKEVMRRTGDTVAIKLYPATRLNKYFDTNRLDINFADSVLWNEAIKNPHFVFTDSYLFVKEYIYFQKDNYIEVNKPADLKGKIVGVTRGYYYAMFEDAFNKGIVEKDEVNTNENLLEKLKTGRNHAILMDNVLFNYLLFKLNCDRSLFKRGTEITNAPLGLKIRIEKKHVLPRLNKAIAEMKKQGIIKEIVKKYSQYSRLKNKSEVSE